MKKEAVMKTMSLSLSLAIVLMSPGLNCWATLSETVNVPRASVDVVPAGLNAQMQSIGEGSAQNFLSKDLLSVSANDALEKTEGPSFRRKPESSKSKILDLGVQIVAVTKAEQAAGVGVTNNKISGLKATLAHHAARGIQAIQKFHQAVLNHIANWSNLFDGSRLQPALAGYGMNSIPKFPPFLRVSREAKNLYLKESSANGADNGSKAESSVPAPGQESPSQVITKLTAEQLAKFKQLADFASSPANTTNTTTPNHNVILAGQPGAYKFFYKGELGTGGSGFAMVSSNEIQPDKNFEMYHLPINESGSFYTEYGLTHMTFEKTETPLLDSQQAQQIIKDNIAFWMAYQIPGSIAGEASAPKATTPNNSIETTGSMIVTMWPQVAVAKIQELKLAEIRVFQNGGFQTVAVTEDLLGQIAQGIFQAAYKQDKPNDIWLVKQGASVNEASAPKATTPNNSIETTGSMIVTMWPQMAVAKIQELKLAEIRVFQNGGFQTVAVTEDLLGQIAQGIFQAAYKQDKPNDIWLVRQGAGANEASAPKAATPNSGSSNKGKIIAGLAIGTVLAAFAPASAFAATVHAALGVGGTLASGVTGGIIGAIVGGAVGVMVAFLYTNQLVKKTGDGDSGMAIMLFAPVFGLIGAVVGGVVGFIGLPLLIAHFMSQTAAFLAPKAVYAATLTAAHAAPALAAHATASRAALAAGVGGLIGIAQVLEKIRARIGAGMSQADALKESGGIKGILTMGLRYAMLLGVAGLIWALVFGPANAAIGPIVLLMLWLASRIH